MPYGTSRSRILGITRRLAPASSIAKCERYRLIMMINLTKYASVKRYCQAFVYQNGNAKYAPRVNFAHRFHVNARARSLPRAMSDARSDASFAMRAIAFAS